MALADTKPLCVVLDTNIWRGQLLLRTAFGAALLFNLRQLNGRIGLPEVVERETVKHLLATGQTARGAVEKGLRQLQRIVGRAPDPPLPPDDELAEAVRNRLAELEPLILRVPFTLEDAVASLDRVNDDQSPFSSGQQFKDAAIWEAVLRLANDHVVHVVSADRAFFASKEPREMHAVLRQEAAEHGSISLHRSIEICVDALQAQAPPIDKDRIVDALAAALTPDVRRSAGGRGFGLASVAKAEIRPYATGDPNRLAVAYTLDWEVVDPTDSGRDATVVVKGEGTYQMDDGQVSDLGLHSIEGEIIEPGLEARAYRDAWAYPSSIVGGIRYADYNEKHQLPDL